MAKTAKALEAEERELQADLDRLIEDCADRERQREARVVAVVLYCVDGLPRHAEPLRQLGLAPSALSPQHP
jgi:hypothetical protein